MFAAALALALAATPAAPHTPGTFRRAATTADGVHVAVFLYRPERPLPGSPLVVLLPELGTTHDVYDLDGVGLARALSARGLTVATLDWRGTGLSQVPQKAPTLDELLDLDLPAAADALGPDTPLVLVGWGYSGALAYAAAASVRFEPRVRGVITLNGVVSLDVPNAIAERLFAQPDGALDLARELATTAPQRDGSLFQMLWLHGAKLDKRVAADLVGHALAPIAAPQVEQVRAWMHSGKTELGGRLYPQLLKDVRAPVMAIEGLRDNWTHPEFAGTVRDFIPEKRLVFQPISRFEGFDEDLGHVGLVLGRTCDTQLVPLMAEFIRTRAVPEPVEVAR